MKTRFSVDADGMLVSRDGLVLGRLTSMTLDVPSDSATSGESMGAMGGSLFLENSKEEKKETPPTPEIATDVQVVWDLYNRLIGNGRRELNHKRRLDIERALKLCGLDLCKQAVIGLSRSAYHNGQNPSGQKYLDIRYALRGNATTGESIDERVERMAQLASPGAVTAAPLTKDRGVLQGRIDSDKQVVQRLWNRDGRPLEAGQADDRDAAIARLAAVGITTSFRDADGWPIFKDTEAS